MAPHNHLQQHHGRSNNDGHQRAQSSTSRAGGAKTPYKRNNVIEAASTRNAQVASTSTSTSRVGRWVQEQRGRTGDPAPATISEEGQRAEVGSASRATVVHQSGQRNARSRVNVPQPQPQLQPQLQAQEQEQQEPFDVSSLPHFAAISRAFSERGLCLALISAQPLNITATLPTTTTISASFPFPTGGRVSASLPWHGGNIAATLPQGHSAEATLPALTSLEVMGAGSCIFGGRMSGAEGQRHHRLLPAREGSRGYGYGRESTTQSEQIEETETDAGSVGDGSATVQ